MFCVLCFGAEGDEHLIDISSAESRRLNIASILHTHFGFCFQEEPTEGFVCQKCWIKVSVFHEFYTHIEYMHRSNESIFVESIVDNIKPVVDSDSDKRELETPSETAPTIDEKPPSFQKRQRGRPRKDDLMKLNDSNSESDDTNHFDDNFDVKFADSPASINQKAEADTVDIQQSFNIVKKPKTKRKRPSKKQSKDSTFPCNDTNKIVERIKKKHTKRCPNASGTFQCGTCDLHFLTYSGRERHLKETHNAKEFKCNEPKCVDSFDTQQLVDDHYATKHKRIECPHCKKKLLATFLARHIQIRHGTGHVVCELCGKVSLNEQLHKQHFKTTHQVVERLQCDLCGQWYKNKHMMRIHMVTHFSGPKKCTICGHVSPHQRAWVVHTRAHRPGIKDRFKCDVCGRGFREKRILAEHYHIHTGTAGSYNCDQCGKTFRFNSSFSVHKKKMHPK